MWLSPHPPPKGYEISYPFPTSGLAGSVLFFPWGVSSLWAERVPHRASALISLNLCKVLAPTFWPWSLPFSYSRYHKARMDVLQADRETSHPKHGLIHTMDGFPLCFLALFSHFHTKFIQPCLHMVWMYVVHAALVSELQPCFCETFLPLCVAQPEQHVLNCSSGVKI